MQITNVRISITTFYTQHFNVFFLSVHIQIAQVHLKALNVNPFKVLMVMVKAN